VSSLKIRGIDVKDITLHVGYGTIQAVRVKDIREHILAERYYSIPDETAGAITKAKDEGRRVVAVAQPL
jgi:S-adenosylmethionine:tRNA ribosyltransferase-isomerase